MAKKLYAYEVKQKANRFLACRNMSDLKNIGLDTNQIQLLGLNPPYYTFERRKESGGMRQIEAPEDYLKELQRKLNFFLQCVYYVFQTEASQGYIIGVKGEKYKKNILENATKHLGSKFMLKVDFKDFFHQFKSIRILKLLQKPPFQFDKKTAHLLVKIFTYKNRLPMGAPTSPALSNLATIEFDIQMTQWASENNIVYTRFVDDLTFSLKETAFTEDHLTAIIKICDSHQLQLNPTKTKFFGEKDLKKVTGLILNETVDIEKAFYNELKRDLKRLRHLAEVNIIINKHKHDKTLKEFKQEVEGQINFIGMIEGYGSPIFHQYRQRMKSALNPDDKALSVRWMNFNYL